MSKKELKAKKDKDGNWFSKGSKRVVRSDGSIQIPPAFLDSSDIKIGTKVKVVYASDKEFKIIRSEKVDEQLTDKNRQNGDGEQYE